MVAQGNHALVLCLLDHAAPLQGASEDLTENISVAQAGEGHLGGRVRWRRFVVHHVAAVYDETGSENEKITKWKADW